MEAFESAKTKPLEERIYPAQLSDYLVRRFSIAGTPGECVERLKELASGGIDSVMVTAPEATYNEVMENWANEVMPHFRGT